MKRIDVETAARLRREITSALAEVGKRNGLLFFVKTVTLNSATTTSFTLIAAERSSIEESDESKSFLESCARVGLTRHDLYTEFVHDGCAYRIVGIRKGAKNYQILCRRLEDIKTYRFGARHIRRVLKKKLAVETDANES